MADRNPKQENTLPTSSTSSVVQNDEEIGFNWNNEFAGMHVVSDGGLPPFPSFLSIPGSVGMPGYHHPQGGAAGYELGPNLNNEPAGFREVGGGGLMPIDSFHSIHGSGSMLQSNPPGRGAPTANEMDESSQILSLGSTDSDIEMFERMVNELGPLNSFLDLSRPQFESNASGSTNDNLAPVFYTSRDSQKSGVVGSSGNYGYRLAGYQESHRNSTPMSDCYPTVNEFGTTDSFDRNNGPLYNPAASSHGSLGFNFGANIKENIGLYNADSYGSQTTYNLPPWLNTEQRQRVIRSAIDPSTVMDHGFSSFGTNVGSFSGQVQNKHSSPKVAWSIGGSSILGQNAREHLGRQSANAYHTLINNPGMHFPSHQQQFVSNFPNALRAVHGPSRAMQNRGSQTNTHRSHNIGHRTVIQGSPARIRMPGSSYRGGIPYRGGHMGRGLTSLSSPESITLEDILNQAQYGHLGSVANFPPNAQNSINPMAQGRTHPHQVAQGSNPPVVVASGSTPPVFRVQRRCTEQNQSGQKVRPINTLASGSLQGPSKKRCAGEIQPAIPQSQHVETKSATPSSLNPQATPFQPSQGHSSPHLPTPTAMPHLLGRPQGDDEQTFPKPLGYKCMICLRDLAFAPAGETVDASQLPRAAILPCQHHFHAFCLEQITPEDRAHDPPCIQCADNNKK